MQAIQAVIPFYQFAIVVTLLLLISSAPAIVIAYRTAKVLKREADDIRECNRRDVERMIARHGNTTY